MTTTPATASDPAPKPTRARQPKDRRRTTRLALRPTGLTTLAWPRHVDALRDLSNLLSDTPVADSTCAASPTSDAADDRSVITASSPATTTDAATEPTPDDAAEPAPMSTPSATLRTRSVA